MELLFEGSEKVGEPDHSVRFHGQEPSHLNRTPTNQEAISGGESDIMYEVTRNQGAISATHFGAEYGSSDGDNSPTEDGSNPLVMNLMI